MLPTVRSKPMKSLSLCSLCLAILSGALAGRPVRADAPQAKPASGAIFGWYEMSPNHFCLVTPSATAGGPWLLDFDSHRYYRMKALGDGAFRWGRDERHREGQFIQGKDGKTAELRWRAPDKSEGVAPRSESYGYSQEEVAFKSGDIGLTGLLLRPRSSGAHPGVVFIHGSGGSGRDNFWPFLLANHLAMNGIAVLLPDKRGTGTSGGDWKSADFWELATDALAGVSVLRAREGVDPRRVGLVGFSQGGWIAPLAAARSRQVAFVVDISGPAVSVKEQTLHETVQDLKRAHVPESDVKELLDLFGLLERHLRCEVPWQDYEAALKAKRAGFKAALFKELPSTPDDWQLGFYQRVGSFDPLPYWRRLEVPSLIVFGELDDSEKAPVRASVARLREALAGKDPAQCTIKVFPDTGHGLFDKTYRLRKDFLDCLTSWIRDRR
jgi:pimeloyl-ACP methyl ester carboxylesterase